MLSLLADEMYNSDPVLKKEFDSKVEEDEKFRDNPRERLNFFYKKSKYYDSKLNVYPILRVIN